MTIYVPDKMMVDDAEIIRANYTCDGGIVHTINKVCSFIMGSVKH